MSNQAKERIIPRFDDMCALCRQRVADKTGSHMVPNFLTAKTFSFDGKAKRDREIVELYNLNEPETNAVYYGSSVSPDKIASDIGHEFSDEEREANLNLLCYDNIFCHQCEDRFGVVESEYAKYYHGQTKNINPRIAYLFWLSVFWRMSLGYMSLFMGAEDELEIRNILNRNLKTKEDIVSSKESLGNYAYAIFQVDEGIIKGDSGILGNRNMKAPYVILVADMVVVFFKNYSKLHSINHVMGWEIEKGDLNTSDSFGSIFEINRKEFHDFRKQLVEDSYWVFNPQQEKAIREIREEERHSGKALNPREKFEILKSLKDNSQTKLRLRLAYRFKIAYLRMMSANENKIEYNILDDKELMLTQQDIDNYIEDLKNFQDHGENVSVFPFAKEYLHDDNLKGYDEFVNKYRALAKDKIGVDILPLMLKGDDLTPQEVELTKKLDEMLRKSC